MKNITILVLLGILTSLSASASTLNCFTKFWGETSSAQVVSVINDETNAGNSVLSVNGKKLSAAVSEPTVSEKGKYTGYTYYNLGTVKGGGYDGGEIYYSLMLPPNFKSNAKFNGIVYLSSQDGYGSRPVSVLCSIKH